MTSMLRHQGDRTATERPTVGDLKMSMVGVDHIGWLKCDGRELPIAGFRHLYDVIGDSFGNPSTPGFFRLPNPKGRVLGIVGQTVGVTSAWTMGDVSGEETHTLTIPELPAHNHDISGGAPDVSGNTSYSATGITVDVSGAHAHTASSAINGSHTHTGTADLNGTHTHTSNANAEFPGAGLVYRNAENTRQDADDGQANEINLDTAAALVINSAGAHTHNLSIAANGDHNHTITVDVSGDHAHGITDPTHRHMIAPNGENQPHNNIQPTIWIGNLFVYSGRLFRDTPSGGNYFPPQGPAVNVN